MCSKALGQALNQIDRTVLTASAADGHRHIAAVVARECVQPTLKKMRNVVTHQLDFRLCFQELSDRLVTPG